MRQAAAIALLCGGCYYLMREEVEKHIRSARLGVLETRGKIEAGAGRGSGLLDTLGAVEINLDTAIDITGRTLAREDIPPCTLTVARYERRKTLRRKAKLEAIGAAIRTRTWDLIAGACGGGGVLAGVTAWALKNRRTIKRMAGYIVQDGNKEIATAKNPVKAQEKLKQRQDKLGIRSAVRKELKNGNA